MKNLAQKYLKFRDQEAIEKLYLAQSRKGRQGSENKYGFFFACLASWRENCEPFFTFALEFCIELRRQFHGVA